MGRSTPDATDLRVPQPNEYRVRLDPVENDGARPLWSVLIPTHNCGEYLAEALASVLDQDPGRDDMEIMVVDDHSTKDNPLAIVEKFGKDRVRYIRQTKNVGKSKNFQTGLEASRGHLIHQLHGDDLVGEGFYRSMESAFAQFPEAGAFFCESEYIGADGALLGRTGKEAIGLGLLENWLEKLVIAQRIQTPSIVARRAVYEKLGGFDSRLPNFEDWEMWVRIATAFQFGFNPHVHAKYRVYSDSTSAMSIASGERTKMLSRALAIMDSYVPEEVLSRCKSKRSRETAHYLIRCIPQARASNSLLTWLRLCREVLRYSVRPREVYYLLNFSLFYKRYLN